MIKRDPAARALALMLGLLIFINYIDRGLIGIAAPLLKQELQLSATGFGLAVSAFYWVYAPSQPIVGWLADRFDPARLAALGLVIWALATAATGLAGGLATLIALRIALGIGEGMAFPSTMKLIAVHIPAAMRGYSTAMITAGLSFGPALGTLIGGLLLVPLGWRGLFVLCGLLSLAWLVPWRHVAPAPPAAAAQAAAGSLPYGTVLRSSVIWKLSIAGCGHAFSSYFLLTWLPLWLVKVRGFDIADMALIAGIVYAVQGTAAIGCGWTTDRLIAAGVPHERLRRGIMLVGYTVAPLCLLATPFITDDRLMIAVLAIAGAGLGASHVTANSVAIGFAGPAAIGRCVGITNGIGNIGGIVSPIVTGILIDATGSFNGGFVLAGIGTMFSWLAIAALPRFAPIDWPAQRSSVIIAA